MLNVGVVSWFMDQVIGHSFGWYVVQVLFSVAVVSIGFDWICASSAVPVFVCVCVHGMRDGGAGPHRAGSSLSQRLREPVDDTDETETISSGEVIHGNRDDIKLHQDNQSSDMRYHRQSGSLSASTPTHRRARPGLEVAHALDELTEISTIAAVVAMQRWWRRHSAGGQRVAQLQRLCRRHVLKLVHRRRTLHTRSKLHAIALQIIFLGIFTFSILYGYSHDRLYRFTRAATLQYLEAPFIASSSNVSKTFFDVASALDLFEWLKGPFISIAYVDNSAVASLANNRIVGGIRIGQLRVQSFNCSSRVTPLFSWTQDDTYTCYGSSDGDFTLSTETNDPIQLSNQDLYVYEGLNGTSTDTERSAFFSTMSVSSAQYSLPAPAYSVVLPRSNAVQASSILTTLEASGYIDGQTRAVMMDLSLYNAMLRQVASLRFLVEMPASGGAITSLSTGVAPLTDSFLFSADHWVVSGCHIIVMLFYAYFFLDEVLALARSRSRQWQYQAVWQRSNLGKPKTRHKIRQSPLHRRHGAGVRLFGLLCYICAWLLRLVALVKRPADLPLDSDDFVSLRPYVETFRAAQVALSASICLTWIELLLMLRVALPVDLLVRAVVCAAPQLFVLLFIMALVVMGYASACILVLGAQSSLFQSLPEALRSLTAILLHTETRTASSLLGSSYGEVGHDAAGMSTLRTLLFACFLLLNIFVAANLFLVVVYEGYLQAKREIDLDRQRLQTYPRSASQGGDEDNIRPASLHLDLGCEIVIYGRALADKFINLVPRTVMMAVMRRKAVEMQSAVLPGDMHSPTSSLTQDESEGESNIDSAYSPTGRFGKQSNARISCSNVNSRKRQTRDSSRDRPRDGTKLLEGMVLQLALQNEALLRAVNELKQDVQALQRSDTGTSELEILRGGSVARAPPARVHKQTPSTGVRSALVTKPDAPNNQVL